jgi:hypothetical protein
VRAPPDPLVGAVVIVHKCDRCGAEILNEHGAQIVWASGKDLWWTNHQRFVTLCANCRLEFENFIADLRKPLP